MSLFYRILQATRDKIVSTGLEGFEPNDVVLQKIPWNRDLLRIGKSKGVFVTPVQPTRNQAEGSNERFQTVYGVLVTVWRASNQDLTDKMEQQLKWTEDLTRMFVDQWLPGITESFDPISVEPGLVFDASYFADKYDVQSIILRVPVRETRVLSA